MADIDLPAFLIHFQTQLKIVESFRGGLQHETAISAIQDKAFQIRRQDPKVAALPHAEEHFTQTISSFQDQ